ncbi:LysR family transcriptional regulator [Zeimonas arvi]|uniref:LysR family transcriptional regulator n=1 Tax=Zeimonas arvi TaxID=2498847 RepID=A0A5C8NVZ5_9BURK|nr:LysR family transcriptional regulator [Zeimonas arvi]TXL65269.1 LysR family transcriptional regulator [Zeimonas arvi]
MRRHVDPVTLRLFVAVCEEGNIARAAAREALVASAVSKRIGAIEREIGAPLLVRNRRGVAPTAAGEVLLRRAREILGALDRTLAELDEFSTGVQGSVRVVASVSALAEDLPDDIASFLAAYQSVRVVLDEAVSTAIVRMVREGAADIGVLWDAADMSALQAVPYRSDRLCAVVHARHPLARAARTTFAETLAWPSIGVTPGGMVESMLRRQAALLGAALTPRIQVASLDAARRIAAAGLGLAILPVEATMPYAGATGLVAVPLTDDWARRQFVVCSRPDSMLSASSRALIDHLRRRAKAGG